MYQVVIVEDDPMVSLLDRTFVKKDTRFGVVQSFRDAQRGDFAKGGTLSGDCQAVSELSGGKRRSIQRGQL